ncbi:MAG TPA: hypothetical protein VHL58_13270 [Thermoanaerobaculia bacterium]|nr:hypothetical protein [Thermoanaerobaculia bacterium]
MRKIALLLAATLILIAATPKRQAVSEVRPASGTPPGILAQYSFDDGLIDTGPDTFAVFQNSKGHVRLSEAIHYSGYRAIELHDVAGDGNFPELQGYFPERTEGRLFFHFSMLVANPDQGFNIALAGPSWFSVEKDGIAFWLKAHDGMLYQVSDSIPKKLFRVDPFTWYSVDVRYDIPRGVYDLTIRREGERQPVVALRNQPNAANAPGSSVDKFSFVGSVFEDDSDVTYYVDDVVVGTDEKLVLGPFVAPGRRKLFIDRWKEAREAQARNPSCPPLLGVEDFGLTAADIGVLEREKAGPALPSLFLADDRTIDVSEISADAARVVAPVNAWRSGCAAMKGDPARAASLFAAGAEKYPSAPIFRFSELIALVRAKRLEEASRLWEKLEPALQRDVRYGTLAAMIGLARGDLSAADRWLAKGVDEVESAIVDQHYFVLLWQREYRRAAELAQRAARRDPPQATQWLERSGDALLLAGAPGEARRFYEQVLVLEPDAYGATTRLADVFFLLGDAGREKTYRERIYGHLSD